MVRSSVLAFALLFTAAAAGAQTPSTPTAQPPLPGNPNTQPPIAGNPGSQPLSSDPNSAYASAPPTFAPAPNTAPQRVHAVHIASDVMAEQVINKVAPVYPAAAKAQHIQGPVVLVVHIGKDGTVQSLRPISGPPALCEPAMDAVKQWTYKPFLLNGEPVEVHTTVTVTFQLNEPPHTS